MSTQEYLLSKIQRKYKWFQRDRQLLEALDIQADLVELADDILQQWFPKNKPNSVVSVNIRKDPEFDEEDDDIVIFYFASELNGTAVNWDVYCNITEDMLVQQLLYSVKIAETNHEGTIFCSEIGPTEFMSALVCGSLSLGLSTSVCREKIIKCSSSQAPVSNQLTVYAVPEKSWHMEVRQQQEDTTLPDVLFSIACSLDEDTYKLEVIDLAVSFFNEEGALINDTKTIYLTDCFNLEDIHAQASSLNNFLCDQTFRY